jgi:hypothetical protein
MSFLGDLFKSAGGFSTKNSEIINALKVLQNSSLADNERTNALTKLKSIFLASNDKTDLKAIIQSILKAATNDQSIRIREIALKTFDSIIEASLEDKLTMVAGYAMPILLEIANHKREDERKLREMSFWVMSKIAPLSINDEGLRFLARSLSDRADNVRKAVISTFENLVKLSDQAQKKRIAQLSLLALCGALKDPVTRVRAAMALGGLGKYGLGAAPFLYERLDDEDGEWAGIALRNVTGEQYGNKEKEKWEKWLQKSAVE